MLLFPRCVRALGRIGIVCVCGEFLEGRIDSPWLLRLLRLLHHSMMPRSVTNKQSHTRVLSRNLVSSWSPRDRLPIACKVFIIIIDAPETRDAKTSLFGMYLTNVVEFYASLHEHSMLAQALMIGPQETRILFAIVIARAHRTIDIVIYLFSEHWMMCVFGYGLEGTRMQTEQPSSEWSALMKWFYRWRLVFRGKYLLCALI